MTHPTREAMAEWFAQEWASTHSREAALARAYPMKQENEMKEHGTNPIDMSPWTRELINAENDAILERHRRYVHRRWVSEIEHEHWGTAHATYKAWMCARLHCGMRNDA